MTWKKLNNLHFGGPTTFGGADIDKISGLFDGTQDSEDVDMNTTFPVRSGKFNFRNPNNTFSYNITPSAITADRTVTLPVLDDTDDFLFANTPETIENKILSNCTLTNTTYQGISDTIKDPIIKRWGTFQPVGIANTVAGVGRLDGILSRHIPSGTAATIGWGTTEGLHMVFDTTTTTNSTCGLFPTIGVPQIRTAKAGRIRIRWTDSHSQYVNTLFGISTQSSIDFINPVPAGQQGFLFGHLGTGTWAVYSHDGAIAEYHTFSTPWQTGFHDFIISWPDGGTPITATLYDGDTRQCTHVPSPNTPLYFWFFHYKLAGMGTNITNLYVKGVWIEVE